MTFSFKSFIAPIALISVILSACGGGGSNDLTTSNEPERPTELTIDNWTSSSNVNLQSRDLTNPVTLSSSSQVSNDDISFYASGLGDLTNKHWQIHIDMDNDPSTGFQFDNQAWSSLSGIDYLVEDGDVYKSNANDGSWSWTKVEDVVFYTEAFPIDGALNFAFNVHGKNLCDKYNIGLIVRDSNWDIELFHPVANQLLEQTTTFCDSNHPPVLALNPGNGPSLGGYNNVFIDVGDQFIDPGATATDVEDGDLTSSIIVKHKSLANNTIIDGLAIDTSIADKYLIIYSVTDSAGNTTKNYRNLTVTGPVVTEFPIVIDGDVNDWYSDPTRNIASYKERVTGYLDITDSEDYLYILVRSTRYQAESHWQIFIDSDNNAQTGYLLGNGGAEYLIEDGDIATFNGSINQYQWAWDFDAGVMDLAQGEAYYSTLPSYAPPNSVLHNVFEIAIPKANLVGLGEKVSVSFSRLDGSWNKVNSLPNESGSLLEYTLSYPTSNSNTDDFKLKVDTSQIRESITDNKSFTIGTKGSGYNYDVDCNDDGSFEATAVTGDYICRYAAEGEYTINISGDFPQIFYDVTDSNVLTYPTDSRKITEIAQWGNQVWRSMDNAFAGAENLIITATDKPNLSQVSSMFRMFRGAEKLDQYIGDWDVSTVTDMSDMFGLAYIFNQDLSNWNVSNVRNMSYMFDEAELFNQDISGWDVSGATKMTEMFWGAFAFNQDIGSWDVSNVENMQNMFWKAESFDQDISSWDVTSVKASINTWPFYGMEGMFSGSNFSTSNYDKLLISWSNQDVQQNIIFGAPDIHYSPAAKSARDKLVNEFNWIIRDAGEL